MIVKLPKSKHKLGSDSIGGSKQKKVPVEYHRLREWSWFRPPRRHLSRTCFPSGHLALPQIPSSSATCFTNSKQHAHSSQHMNSPPPHTTHVPERERNANRTAEAHHSGQEESARAVNSPENPEWYRKERGFRIRRRKESRGTRVIRRGASPRKWGLRSEKTEHAVETTERIQAQSSDFNNIFLIIYYTKRNSIFAGDLSPLALSSFSGSGMPRLSGPDQVY